MDIVAMMSDVTNGETQDDQHETKNAQDKIAILSTGQSMVQDSNEVSHDSTLEKSSSSSQTSQAEADASQSVRAMETTQENDDVTGVDASPEDRDTDRKTNDERCSNEKSEKNNDKTSCESMEIESGDIDDKKLQVDKSVDKSDGDVALDEGANKDEVNNDEDDAEEESEDDEPRGLLEQPLVLEKGSKREKKKVQRLDTSVTGSKEIKPVVIQQGQGIKLTDCPYIEFQIQKTTIENLMLLHKIIYTGHHKKRDVKKNLRQFSGLNCAQNDSEYERTLTVMGKYTVPGLASVCDILGIEHVGKKEVIMERIMEYLRKPYNHGKAIPTAKKRKSSKKRTRTKKSKGGKVDKSEPAGTVSGVGENDGGHSEDSEKESVASDSEDKAIATEKSEEPKSEEEAESGVESDEEKSPAKKPKVSPVKKESKQKVLSKEPDKISAKSPDKTPAKAPEKVSAKVSAKVSSGKGSAAKSPTKASAKKEANSKTTGGMKKHSGDTTTAKKSHKRNASGLKGNTDQPKKRSKGPPSNDELKESIKKILETADLEQVTMKTVLKQVNELYPAYDLSDKKAFMKTIVWELIS